MTSPLPISWSTTTSQNLSATENFLVMLEVDPILRSLWYFRTSPISVLSGSTNNEYFWVDFLEIWHIELIKISFCYLLHSHINFKLCNLSFRTLMFETTSLDPFNLVPPHTLISWSALKQMLLYFCLSLISPLGFWIKPSCEQMLIEGPKGSSRISFTELYRFKY